jgi:hypothetical protein
VFRAVKQESLEGAVMKSHSRIGWRCFRIFRKQLPHPILFCFSLVLALFAITAPAYALDVTLAWDSNTEPDLAGYKLYYKTGSSGPPYAGTGAAEGDSPIEVFNVTQFTVHGLANGVTYYFVVTAYDDENNESGYSNEVSTSETATVSITSPENGFFANASNYTAFPVGGTAEASATVEIFANATSLGTTTALTNGTWTISGDFTPCMEGPISLTAESNSTTSNAVTGTYDKTPPNPPDVSGTTPTNDTTPTWSWSSGGSGNGTYRYKLDDSNLNSGATQTSGTTFTPGSSLSQGLHNLYVQERDAAANWSSSGSFTIEIDTTAPAAPVITTNGGNGPGNDCTTSNASLLLEGTCAADTVTIRINGSTSGVAYTPGETSWSYSGTLQSGENTLNVTAIDAAGNTSTPDSITITYNPTYGAPIGGYTTDHVIPEAQISQSTTGNGDITIHFKIKDPTSDPCTLHTFEYSTNGGTSWIAPTNGDNSGSLSTGWGNNNVSGYSSAPSFASAQDHSFTFATKHPDVSGLNGVDQSDVRVRFTINDGTYDSVLPVSSESFRVDNLNPAGSVSYSDPNSSHVDVGTLTITAAFTEPLGAAPHITIDRPNPMLTVGPAAMSGSGSTWTYDLTIERHDGDEAVDGVYLVTISNVSDVFGNPGGKTSNFTTDTRDTDSDNQRDYEDSDDDNDELPDAWEQQYGLDPLDATGINGKDGDFDSDTWSNYEEYIGNTDPADDTSFPTASAPEIVEAMPHHDAGIGDDTLVPNDSSFSVRVQDTEGIDITDANSISLTIDDGVNVTYSRDLSDDTIMRVKKLTDDDSTSVTQLWVSYDRALDTTGNFQFDAIVTVTVDVMNRRGVTVQGSYDFKIETQEEYDYAHDPANLPETAAVSESDPAMQGLYDTGIRATSPELDGAKIIYVGTEAMIPGFGPLGLIKPAPGSRGEPVNLLPNTVFDEPVKVFIPYPNSKNVSHQAVYVYKGGRWVVGCDSKGRVRPGGEGWMVPGSRVNHDEMDVPTIEIKVYHFSAIQAADDPGDAILPDPSPPSLSGAEPGGGCFISTTAPDSNTRH